MLLQLHGGVGPPPYRTTFLKRTMKRIYDSSLAPFILRNSDVIASVSSQDLQYLISHYNISNGKLRHVPNCVDIDEFRFSGRDLRRDEPVLLYIGDLERWKGLNLIYEWLLKENKTPAHHFTFRFVGQGSLYSKLEHLKRSIDAKQNGIKVELLGQKAHSEIPRIMANSDALVLPSYWEGLPTVVLEAMAAGLPVVATPVGDIPILLKNGENGLLIRRNVESLDSALHYVLNRDPKLGILARGARRLVEAQYNIGCVYNTLNSIYSEIGMLS